MNNQNIRHISVQISSHQKKLNELKKSNYFLMYWYLKLNQYSTIVINTNNIHNRTNQNMPNYSCDCIFFNDKFLYEMGSSFEFHYDKQLEMNTIIFDNKTGLPIRDLDIKPTSLTELKRRIILQHILFHEVNRLMKEYKCQLIIKSKHRNESNKLQMIELDKMICFKNKSNEQLVGDEWKQYNDFVSETVADYIDFYLNKRRNKFDILVIGNEIEKTGIYDEGNYIQIHSFDFIHTIDSLVENLKQEIGKKEFSVVELFQRVFEK